MGTRKRQSGFTLIEMLFSLVLLVLLLGAIAAATRASLSSYNENAKLAALSQTARVLQSRLRREIRTAEAVDHGADPGNIVISPPEATGVDEIRYEYVPGTQTLQYHRTINGETTTETIMGPDSTVRPVGMYATYDTTVIDEVTCTQRVVVTLALEVDGRSYTIVCSAAPRRNQSF